MKDYQELDEKLGTVGTERIKMLDKKEKMIEEIIIFSFQ